MGSRGLSFLFALTLYSIWGSLTVADDSIVPRVTVPAAPVRPPGLLTVTLPPFTSEELEQLTPKASVDGKAVRFGEPIAVPPGAHVVTVTGKGSSFRQVLWVRSRQHLNVRPSGVRVDWTQSGGRSFWDLDFPSEASSFRGSSFPYSPFSPLAPEVFGKGAVWNHPAGTPVLWPEPADSQRARQTYHLPYPVAPSFTLSVRPGEVARVHLPPVADVHATLAIHLPSARLPDAFHSVVLMRVGAERSPRGRHFFGEMVTPVYNVLALGSSGTGAGRTIRLRTIPPRLIQREVPYFELWSCSARQYIELQAGRVTEISLARIDVEDFEITDESTGKAWRERGRYRLDYWEGKRWRRLCERPVQFEGLGPDPWNAVYPRVRPSPPETFPTGTGITVLRGRKYRITAFDASGRAYEQIVEK